MILVTTAGKVGSEAVRSLTLREMPVRVLARDPGKAKALATVDNAHMRYFVAHLHRLLDPAEAGE